MLIFLVSWAQPASALPLLGRSITGTIQEVDVKNHKITMLRADTGTSITFSWIKRTTFVARGKMTDAAILRKGARVIVRHQVPFFGKPFVTRVTLTKIK